MRGNFFELGFAFGSTFLLSVIPFVLLSLAIPYAVLRLRNEEPADSQLGTKIGLQFFFSVAVMILLVGLTVMAVDLVNQEEDWGAKPLLAKGRPVGVGAAEKEWFNTAQRTGLGMVVSGLMLALFHLLVAKIMTNKVQARQVRRIFVGWRFAIQGMVLMFSVTALVVTVMQRDPFLGENIRMIKTLAAVLGVWFPFWLVHLLLLQVYSRRPRTELK